MKVTLNKHEDQPQPAIDTVCDNCSAIYDLLDCSTCACGKTLCPECSCENLVSHTARGERAYRLHHTVPVIFNRQNGS